MTGRRRGRVSGLVLGRLFGDATDRRYRVVRRGLALVVGLRLLTGSFADLADQLAVHIRPPGLLAWLDRAPSARVLVAVQAVGLVAAALAVSGWGVRGSAGGRRWAGAVAAGALPLAWLALLFLTAVKTSGGKVLHNDVLLLLAAAPVLLVPENRAGRPRRNVGWPIGASILVIALAYWFAAVAKLVHTGPSWVFSDNLRYVMYWSAQTPRPAVPSLTATIADHGWLAVLVAASIMGIELLAPAVVVWPRVRPAFVAGAVALHLGTWATLGIDYWGWALTVVVVLLDWGGERRAARHAGEVTATQGLLVFDGDCAFCTRSAEWVARRAGRRARVAPWSALDLDGLGLTLDQVLTSAWWIGPDGGRPEGGHLAIARALQAVGGPWWLLGRLLALRVVGPIGRPAYALVARYRHRLPGGTAACRLPTSQTDAPQR